MHAGNLNWRTIPSACHWIFINRLGDVCSRKPRTGCALFIPYTNRNSKRAKADVVPGGHGKFAAGSSFKFEWSKAGTAGDSPYLIGQHGLFIRQGSEEYSHKSSHTQHIYCARYMFGQPEESRPILLSIVRDSRAVESPLGVDLSPVKLFLQVVKSIVTNIALTTQRIQGATLRGDCAALNDS